MGSLYLDNFSRIDGADVAAVASASYPRQEAEKRGLKLYATQAEMLDAGLDVCCICTPTFLHFEQIKASLERGIHTIAEKPLAFTAREARELYSLAESNGALLFTAQVVRFAFSTKLLKDLITGNKYGRVHDAFFFRISTTPVWCRDSWIFDSRKSGLVTYDMHLHDLDLIIYLFGKPIAARMFEKPANLPLIVDFGRYQYSYNDFNVFSEAAWYNAKIPFRAGFRVVFEDAVVECENDIVQIHTKDGEHLSFAPQSGDASETGINVPKTDMYLTELSHFTGCINKGIPSDIVKNEEIIILLETLESLHKTHP